MSGQSPTNGQDPNKVSGGRDNSPSPNPTPKPSKPDQKPDQHVVVKKVYKVVSGDNMSAIAKSFGMSLQALLAENPQVKGPEYEIQVGQLITISIS